MDNISAHVDRWPADVKQTSASILQVALAVPLRKVFDYLAPQGVSLDQVEPGMRVQVPFGRSRKVGVVVALATSSDVPANKLKAIHSILDAQACLDKEQLKLLNWAADYYQHPIGEVLSAALPRKLRDGVPLSADETVWRCATTAPAEALAELKRAPRQAELWQLLSDCPDGMDQNQLGQLEFDARAALRALKERGWIEAITRKTRTTLLPSVGTEQAHTLNDEQQIAVDALLEHARKQGAITVLPVLNGETLLFAPFDDQTAMIKKRFGLLEPDVREEHYLKPEELDCILVPLVAFDDHANRMGMGGGFYDKSFAFTRDVSNPPSLIGVAHELQKTASVFHEWWDVPLDKVVTDAAVYLGASHRKNAE